MTQADLAPGRPALVVRVTRILSQPLIRAALPLLILGIAGAVLYRLAQHVSWQAVKADLARAPLEALLLAVLATAVSFAALSLYDVLAVRSVARGRIPARIAAVAGASGFAVSNLLGFSWLTGTAVRYRIYSALGLDMGLVAGVIATSWVAFWMGVCLILGGLLAFHPLGLSQVIAIPPGVEQATGLAVLALLAGFFYWLSRGRQSLRVIGMTFAFPGLRLASLLMAAAVLDIVGAALTLYVLMPAGAAPNVAVFFMVYIAAISLGILSHAPGGLGVLEATMIAGLGAGGRSDVLAALLLYRLIYTLLPFALAALGLAAVWTATQRHFVVKVAQGMTRSAAPARALANSIVPLIAAGIALLSGLILLLSGTLPADTARLGVLRGIVPLPFVEASHLIGSVAGVLLIVVTRGLYRKLYRAWGIAMGLLVIGLIASLAKGLDWKEALSLLASLALLGVFRTAFYRVDGAAVFRLNAAWLLSVVAVLVTVFWVGLFAYSHIAYRDTLWWDFAWHGDASRFLRASLAAAVVALIVSFNSVVMHRGRRTRPQPIPQAVRDLLAASPDADAQLALTGDKAFLLATDNRAFLAYADTGWSYIAKGDPVGDAEAGRQLIWQLREQADQAGRRCAFYAVSPAYLPTYLDLGLSILKIGEIARVRLAGFSLDGPSRKDFRYAAGKAAREGYEFALIPAREAAALYPELKRISDAWLASKQGTEKAFALGACTPDYLCNFDHAVLRHIATGAIVAFANLLQGADKQELSLDLIRYDPAGPKFAMDALFGQLLLWARDQGFVWFSLGAAPLSGLDSHKLASLWNRIGGFVYAHGEHFYHFEGLRSFKQKFDPVWSPNYLASPGGLAVPRVFFEVNSLISGGIRGLMK